MGEMQGHKWREAKLIMEIKLAGGKKKKRASGRRYLRSLPKTERAWAKRSARVREKAHNGHSSCRTMSSAPTWVFWEKI